MTVIPSAVDQQFGVSDVRSFIGTQERAGCRDLFRLAE